MKRLTLLSIGLVIGLAGCIIINPGGVKGSGIAKTETRSLGSFNALDVEYAGAIAVRSQEQQSLEISGDDNIIPFITTEVKNGTLYVRATKGYSPEQKLQIRVSTPNVKRFVFDGVGEANLSNIKNDRLEIVLTGVGSFSASGETKEADITVSGVGSLDAKNLRAVNAKVNSSAVGNADLYVTGQLDVNASGVGEVNYYGNPKIVNRQAEGIGKINQR
ncbi:head GIN domain-containing protein [Phormidesmis priestleyi]|uniref:head GIN domain-containing protein n=1 Tax=Phormidesmis priestleyi TaxID=268141 RepID=UPI00083B8E11|nr:head GIN domain-containing protein [Phormidesmis priestleyi]